MSDVVSKFLELPFSRVFIFIGIIFMFFSIVNKLALKNTILEFSRFGRIMAFIIGFAFLIIGIIWYAFELYPPVNPPDPHITPIPTLMITPSPMIKPTPKITPNEKDKRGIIDNLNTAMNKSSYRCTFNIYYTSNLYEYYIIGEVIRDIKNQINYFTYKGMMEDTSYEYYYDIKNRISYIKTPQNNKWSQTNAGDYDSPFNLTVTDYELSRLALEKGSSGEYMLKGDTSIDNIVKGVLNNYFSIHDFNITDAYTELSINQNTFNENYDYSLINGNAKSINGDVVFKLELKESFTDYNGNFNLRLPVN